MANLARLPPTSMSRYESDRWRELTEHWDGRANRRGLPNWISDAAETTADTLGKAADGVANRVPKPVVRSAEKAATFAVEQAARPTVEAVLRVLELIDEWVMELTNPAAVVKIANKKGIDISDFTELSGRDLKDCDRLLNRSTLQWSTTGALEGAGMGALSLVPVAGIPASLMLDTVVVQALSTAIAARIAYSYGFDARDPVEQEFIQQLVKRAFVAQTAKVKPLVDAGRAFEAGRGRIKWSPKLREDHRLMAALEKIMKRWYPKGFVPVKDVTRVLPGISILVGATSNSWLLGHVAHDSRRFCATRFLCEKYELDFPSALVRYGKGGLDQVGFESDDGAPDAGSQS